MTKIIIKTTLKTLLALLVACIAVFAVMSLGFPQHMATMFENLGAYGVATGYASLRYTYTKDIGDLDRCARDSIVSGDNGNIVKYCLRLTEDEGFDGLCESSSGDYDYRQYICSNLACAQYATGDSANALATATAAMDGIPDFPEGNAISALAVRIAEAKDGENATALLAATERHTPAESQQRSYDAVVSLLRGLVD